MLNKNVQFLLKRLFGRKSEKLDPNRLEPLLSDLEAISADSYLAESAPACSS